MHLELTATGVLAIPFDKGIGIVRTSFIIEGDTIGLTCFKAEVLWNGLIDQFVTSGQAIGLERPVTLNDIVNLLIIPAPLSIRIVAF